MGPDPAGIFTAGLLLGALGTLIVQWYGRRKAAKAIQTNAHETLSAHDKEAHETELKRLKDRIAVMERITTDPATRTAQEIEQLREEANKEKA